MASVGSTGIASSSPPGGSATWRITGNRRNGAGNGAARRIWVARIAGIDIPREKRVEVALTYIYGIGLSTSQRILKQTSINPDTRVRDLTDDQVNRLREVIDRSFKVEGDLRREVA